MSAEIRRLLVFLAAIIEEHGANPHAWLYRESVALHDVFEAALLAAPAVPLRVGQFRKKPVVIEAVRYIGGGNVEPRGAVPDWLWDALANGTARYVNGGDPLLLKTLEGDLTVSPGDWIIRGVKGELYPCKPDVFEMTYDVLAAPAVPQEANATAVEACALDIATDLEVNGATAHLDRADVAAWIADVLTQHWPVLR